jgi:hypothetical protein
VPVDVMRGFPALGTVLPLVPFDMAEDDLAPQLPLAGDWVKLRNIGCRIRKGLYEGVIHRKSKIGILSPSIQAVQNCERYCSFVTCLRSGCQVQLDTLLRCSIV